MNIIAERHLIVLGVGLLFPLISWFSFTLSSYGWFVRKQRSSAVLIPFIGPVVLDVWLFLNAAPYWVLLLPWVLDIGTVAFLIAIPRMAKEWWQTSSFTLTSTLTGEQGNQTAKITLHKTGTYLLRKEWHRPSGEFGVASLGELGHFVIGETEIQLNSDNGWSRTLKRQADNQFIVEETNNAHADYSLQGWTLQLV